MADHRYDLIEFGIENEALTIRELAIKSTDEKRYYVSGSAYQPEGGKSHHHTNLRANLNVGEFHNKTTAINQMRQTDFTYFKIIGWGWYYLSRILDDYRR